MPVPGEGHEDIRASEQHQGQPAGLDKVVQGKIIFCGAEFCCWREFQPAPDRAACPCRLSWNQDRAECRKWHPTRLNRQSGCRDVFFWISSASPPSKFFRRRKRQAALAVVERFQSPVFGTAFAPDDAGRDQLAYLATKAPALQPVFVADAAFNRNGRGLLMASSWATSFTSSLHSLTLRYSGRFASRSKSDFK